MGRTASASPWETKILVCRCGGRAGQTPGRRQARWKRGHHWQGQGTPRFCCPGTGAFPGSFPGQAFKAAVIRVVSLGRSISSSEQAGSAAAIVTAPGEPSAAPVPQCITWFHRKGFLACPGVLPRSARRVRAGTYEFRRFVKICSAFSLAVITATPARPHTADFREYAAGAGLLRRWPPATVPQLPTEGHRGRTNRRAARHG